MKLHFKTWKIAFELQDIAAKLQEVLIFVLSEAESRKIEMEVTEISRKDGGVHGTEPVRGIDLVPVVGSWKRSVEVMQIIRTLVNDNWFYGKGDFEVCPPVRGGTAPHIHLQVCHLTRKDSFKGEDA